jgi:hypothetical protein
VPTSFYDVVVLGTQLEPLLCAALLGREGLRVLVLGQGTLEPSYMLDGVEVEAYGLPVAGIQSRSFRTRSNCSRFAKMYFSSCFPKTA